MATRQYIGARYVLKVYTNSQDPSSAEWESGVVYEPLTMVTYQNSSYVSRSQVPASAGNPATATTYWAITGAYNGQIASLQNQIDAINSELTELIFPRVYGKSIGIYGDSWSGMTPYNAWVTTFFSLLGDNAANFNVSGAGRSFANIRTAVADSNTADIYIINGGNNDWVQQRLLDDVKSDLNAIVSTLKSKSPNAEIYFMLPPKYMDWDTTNWGQQYIPLTIYRKTISSCVDHGCGVIDCNKVPRFEMDSTRNHYKPSLAPILAESVAQQVNAGGVEAPDYEITTLVPDIGVCYFSGEWVKIKVQNLTLGSGGAISIANSKYSSHCCQVMNMIDHTVGPESKVWPYTYTVDANGISGVWYNDRTQEGTITGYWYPEFNIRFHTKW